jgi:hypothetical protein
MRLAVLLALALVACGGSADKDKDKDTPQAKTTPAATASPSAAPTVAPEDQAACSALYARLQRVGVALSSSSELLTQSLNPKELSSKIATEQEQLERSAQLMDSAVVPAPLADDNRKLVKALRRYAHDFAGAKAPARQGDFQAAAQAMTDQEAVNDVLAAAKAIEATCKP